MDLPIKRYNTQNHVEALAECQALNAHTEKSLSLQNGPFSQIKTHFFGISASTDYP